MLEMRFHGRGGQGAVTSAELVARAAVDAGNSDRYVARSDAALGWSYASTIATVSPQPLLGDAVASLYADSRLVGPYPAGGPVNAETCERDRAGMSVRRSDRQAA